MAGRVGASCAAAFFSFALARANALLERCWASGNPVALEPADPANGVDDGALVLCSTTEPSRCCFAPMLTTMNASPTQKDSHGFRPVLHKFARSCDVTLNPGTLQGNYTTVKTLSLCNDHSYHFYSHEAYVMDSSLKLPLSNLIEFFFDLIEAARPNTMPLHPLFPLSTQHYDHPTQPF